MYKLINLKKQLNIGEECVLLLGGFDGIHLGHQTLLQSAKKYALPIGITSIVGGKGKSIFTKQERAEVFLRLGIDFVLEMQFEEICNLSPKTFTDRLLQDFNVKAFLCGEDFRFGYQAQGDANFLKECAQVCVETKPLVQFNGEKVSSTAVKLALEAGDIPTANALLNQSFFLQGKVEKDRQVGRTIGFPTANIAYPDDKFPLKEGVYQTQVEVSGKRYSAITNYGDRPTFENQQVWTESHLIQFNGDLYGKTLKVEFIRRLRDIQKFQTIEELQAQLQADVRRVQND